MDIITTLKALLSSRKAVVMIVVLILVALGVHFGRVPWNDQTEDFVKWLVTAWLGAQAAEDISKHHAKPKAPEVEEVTLKDIVAKVRDDADEGDA